MAETAKKTNRCGSKSNAKAAEKKDRKSVV